MKLLFTHLVPKLAVKLLFYSLLVAFVFIAAGTNSYGQANEIVTNETVLKLQKAGLNKDIIKSKIESSQCNFNLSVDALLALKKAGVADDVVTAMLGKTKSAQQPADPVAVNNSNNSAELALESGIYYYNASTSEYVELDPAVLTNSKSGGMGEALKRSVSTLFNSKSKAALSGKEANLRIKDSNPLFVFVFDTDKKGLNDNNHTESNVESPNEFFLVRLQIGKNDREVVVGKSNSVSADFGIDEASKVLFKYKKIKRGIYEVSFSNGIPIGEYCFMYGASTASAQGITHKVFDFGIAAN
ncbi:hypothetical protein [Mucilaginibacter flavidus]|uniref:hypothetical protein n=1 Tax=Mucilaginibacter flavidus TaxID=2949309 RepID=UPI0020940064|nr:hypothetical protein [Mucilaginibacter flavidus]MCO5945380.1 hypothetical protein [Mucilaginibacter flavidus]